MTNKDKTRKHLEALLREKTELFEKETAWIRQGLIQLTENSEDTLKSSIHKIETLPKSQNINAPLSVKEKIIKILKEKDCPMSSVEIMKKINADYGNPYKKFSSFSGLISQIHSRPSSEFTKVIVPQGGKNYKFVYALKSWTENGDLKLEYYNKLAERIGLQLHMV